MVVVTTVVVAQETKRALLPVNQTRLLWIAELAIIGGVVVLRSSWLRDTQWRSEQERLGTLANNFYEPRRDALLNGGAVAGGLLGGVWWGAATWGVLFTAMRQGAPTRGLFSLEIAALVGALTGGVIGAVTGLTIGDIWERRHRKNRLSQQATHA